MSKVSLDGWLQWEIIENNKVVKGGEQHNLFLDEGLDLMAEHGPEYVGNYISVGTGTGEPDISDKLLDNEVARISKSTPWAEVTKLGNGIYEAVWVREFEENQAVGNLTEWGCSPTEDGNLSVRELFRDSGGTPIVISKQANQRLRMTYSLRVFLSPTRLTQTSFDLTGVGTISAQHCLTYSSNSSVKDKDWQTFIAVVCPKAKAYAFGLSLAGAQNFNGYDLATSSSYRLPGVIECARMEYTPGSFTRRVLAEFGPSEAVGDLYGIVISGDTARNRNIGVGWAARFDPGFRKPDTYKLDFDALGFTWGRA